MYKKFVRDYKLEFSENDISFEEYFNRRRMYFEHNMETLDSKLTKELQIGHTEKLRLMRENSMLTQEINQIRNNIRFSKQLEKINMAK